MHPPRKIWDFLEIGFKSRAHGEATQGLFQDVDRWCEGFTENDEIIREHEMGDVELSAVGVVLKMWMGADFLHDSREIVHYKHEEQWRKGITLAQSSTSLETTLDAAIEVERKFNIGYAGHDPIDISRWETKSSRKCQCTESKAFFKSTFIMHLVEMCFL